MGTTDLFTDSIVLPFMEILLELYSMQPFQVVFFSLLICIWPWTGSLIQSVFSSFSTQGFRIPRIIWKSTIAPTFCGRISDWGRRGGNLVFSDCHRSLKTKAPFGEIMELPLPLGALVTQSSLSYQGNLAAAPTWLLLSPEWEGSLVHPYHSFHILERCPTRPCPYSLISRGATGPPKWHLPKPSPHPTL